MNTSSQTGQTLIEVVVVAGMVMLVMVALVSGVVMSLANNRLSKDRSLATRYAQEGVEWLRKWRDTIGWQPLAEELSEGVYCVNTLPNDLETFQALAPEACGDTVIEGTALSRSLTINEVAGMDRFDFTSTVSWDSGGKSRDVSLTGRINKWQQ